MNDLNVEESRAELMNELYRLATQVKNIALVNPLLMQEPYQGVRSSIEDIAGQLMSLQADFPAIEESS